MTTDTQSNSTTAHPTWRSHVSIMASRLVPSRRAPYGTGWGPGYLEWPQKEGFEIRVAAEHATQDAIFKTLKKDGVMTSPDDRPNF